MVKLPAEACPSCGTNLRTGERPEKETSVWQRRGFKPLVLGIAVIVPFTAWAVTSGFFSDLNWMERIRVGLLACADPPRRMWEDPEAAAQEQESAKQGYQSWKERKRSRPQGQNPTGPESEEERKMNREQRAARDDRRNYFANTLISERASPRISDSDNWYAPFVGEWEAALVTGFGTDSQKIVQGEWNFSWINAGEAMQDILAVPYLWDSAKAKNPLRASTLRTYNEERGVWEGVHVQAGRIFPFNATRNPDGNIYESYLDGQSQVTWIYYNIADDGFQVTVNQTEDGGRTYRLSAELWAKRRGITAVP
jgi:hypothetical protein